MRLIVITPSKDVPDETTLVTKMFESGLQTLHLRKPRHSTNRMADYIREIPAHFHNRIVVHSHHSLALRFKLKGIHLSRTHLNTTWRYWFIKARLRMRFSRCSKSRSYTRLQQAYNKEEEHFDYFLLGTVFNNMTGELYSGFYEDGLIAANKNSGKKLVARGGTSPKVIERAVSLGFWGISFNSFIWSAEHPFESFQAILKEFRRLNLELL